MNLAENLFFHLILNFNLNQRLLLIIVFFLTNIFFKIIVNETNKPKNKNNISIIASIKQRHSILNDKNKLIKLVYNLMFIN